MCMHNDGAVFGATLGAVAQNEKRYYFTQNFGN